jgi:transposase
VIGGKLAVYLAIGSVDLRGTFDKLCHLTHEVLEKDPQSGALFIFLNKKHNRLKALWWDRNGYTILYKRLAKGSFPIPVMSGESSSIELTTAQFTQLLAGLPITIQDSPTLH